MTNHIDYQHLALHDRHATFNRLGHTTNERRAYETHWELCNTIPKVVTREDAAELIRWIHAISSQLRQRMGYAFLPVEAMNAWKELAVQSGEFRFPADDPSLTLEPTVTKDERLRRPKIPTSRKNKTRFSAAELQTWKSLYTTLIESFPIDYRHASNSYFTARAWIVNNERIFTFNTDETLSKEARATQVRLREFLSLHKDYFES